MDTRFAAAYLGYSPATLRLWRKKRSGPKFFYVGRFVEYQKDDLDLWAGGDEIVAMRRAERRAKAIAARKSSVRVVKARPQPAVQLRDLEATQEFG